MPKTSNSNDINYSEHINVSSPIQEVVSIDQIILLQKILTELQKVIGTSLTTYHVSYSINTSITTKQKIDIVSDTGSYAIEMTILDKGGGFDLYINDESISIRAHNGLKVTNENIGRLYWAGTGNTGTGKIRIGLAK